MLTLYIIENLGHNFRHYDDEKFQKSSLIEEAGLSQDGSFDAGFETQIRQHEKAHSFISNPEVCLKQIKFKECWV